MTILPKAKSSGPNNKSREPRDQANSSSFDQAVGGSNSASGWGPGVVGSPSGSGWSPGGPPVPGPSSSPRWNGSAVPGTSGGLGQVEGGQGSKKRPAPAAVVVSQAQSPGFYGNYEELEQRGFSGGGPTSTKRGRHCVDGGPADCSRTSPEPGTSGHMCDSNADGYNSEDEYSHLGVQMSEEEWEEKDRRFDRLMKRKGYVIKAMQEDGSCLFRAVADQIYGDQGMHEVVRDHCMNYIEQNSDYFSHYMTERVSDYVERKRFLGVHGNHLEIQALSEMYNRPIHIYCYSAEPINIFQGNVKSEHINVPIRLCYHRAVHYNSLVDPNKPTIGVGLGLPNYSPGSADRNLVGQAMKQSENDAVEKTMLEDKIRATDWEATNEAIEEQVARESYLQWLRDNERRNGRSQRPSSTSTTATVTSGELRVDVTKAGGGQAGAQPPSARASVATPPGTVSGSSAAVAAVAHLASTAGPGAQMSPTRSPKPSCSFRSTNSPRAGCSSERDSPKPSGSCSPRNTSSKGRDLQWSETASFLHGLPSELFGLEAWNETDVLTQVLAASQQEYLDSLKKQKKSRSPSPPSGTSNNNGSRGGGGGSDSKSDRKQKSKNSPKSR